MKCNIDAHGKRVRLIGGMITLVVSLLLFALYAWSVMPGWGLYLAIIVCIAGLFQIYEARQGWCVLRAMGIKTPV